MANVGTAEHMRFTWDWCRKQCALRSCGSDCNKLSRWWSFEQQSQSILPHLQLDLLILLWLGFRRRWWSEGQCPLFCEQDRRDGCMEDDLQAPFPGELAEANLVQPDEEASSQARGAAQGPSSSRNSVADCKREAEKRRGQTRTQLEYCCKLLTRRLNVRLWVSMIHLTDPLHAFFGDAIAKVKTIMGVQDFHVGLAEGSLMLVCKQLLDHLFSKRFAEIMGLSREQLDAGRPEDDRVVLSSMFHMALRLVGNLLCTAMV